MANSSVRSAVPILSFVSAFISVAGVLLLAETCRRGTLNWHRRVPSVLGFCFAVGLTATGTEIAARILAPESDSAPLLPNLPEPAVGMPPLVAAISGSTMQGFLYSPHYGIAQVAEWRLRQSLAEEFEVTNLAMTRASLAVAAAEFKKLDRQPDLLIVYSGHNEFFHELLETGWVGFGN